MSQALLLDFTAKYQPNEGGEPVVFKLRPFSFAEFGRFQSAMRKNDGEPDFDTCRAVFVEHVVGWSGLAVEFTEKARRQFTVDDEFAVGFGTRYLWMGEVAGHLYVNALLPKAEAKN